MLNNLKYQFAIITFSLMVITSQLYAAVKLPAFFCDNMVLQQQSNVAIWGEADPKENIEIVTSWNNELYSTKSDIEGKWKVKIKTPQAGGPYSISISDSEEIELSNVLVGEVWICSGQSNMDMPMKGYRDQPVKDGHDAIVRSKNESIRLFDVKNSTSLTPLDDVKGTWQECTPGSVAEFSATAYYFGRLLQETLQVPVGLICTAWGGTIIECWMSKEELEKYNFVSFPKEIPEPKLQNKTPMLIYNGMVHPLIGYGIKGAIWYQGESNRNETENYAKLFPGLINQWRSDWGIGDFPFYFTQIAPYDYSYSKTKNSAFMRETQLNVAKMLPNVEMVSLLDVGEKHCIHPSNKKVAGERLTYLALANSYGIKGIACSGPRFNKMMIEGNVVTLTFKHAENGLTTFGKELTLFSVAGSDKTFYPAKAEIKRGSRIVLSSDQVSEPVAVRYAFCDFVVGELFNTAGLPASSFRTDNWDE